MKQKLRALKARSVITFQQALAKLKLPHTAEFRQPFPPLRLFSIIIVEML
jgi:hypothetical protein